MSDHERIRDLEAELAEARQHVKAALANGNRAIAEAKRLLEITEELAASNARLQAQIHQLTARAERAEADMATLTKALDAERSAHRITRTDRDEWKQRAEKAEQALDKTKRSIVKLNAFYRCEAHPDVRAFRHWGCPDCLTELRRERTRLEQLEAQVLALTQRAEQAERERDAALAQVGALR